MSEGTISLFSRLLFIGAFALLALSLLEGAVRQMGYTILRDSFSPSRLLEYAAILMIFVVALLLRQIRDRVKAVERVR